MESVVYDSIYGWLWTYWGVVITGIAVGLVTTTIGAGAYTDTGLLAFGIVTLIGTVLYSIIWAIVGPFSVHWILIPVGLISFIMFIAGKEGYEDEPVRGSILLFVVIGLAYLVTFDDKVRATVAPATFLARQGAPLQSESLHGEIERLWKQFLEFLARQGAPPQGEGGQQAAAADQKSASPAPAATIAELGGDLPVIPDEKSASPTPAAMPSGNVPAPSESGAMFTKDDDGWWHVSRGGGVNDPGGGLRRVTVRDFWPAGVSQTQQGFLATADGTAIRVLASGYLVPLFDTPETAFPGGVVDIMKPFRAYYVIRKQDTSLLVAEPPFTSQSRTFWARQGDCYVWATGLAAEVKGGLSVYAREEDARAGSGPLTPADKYISTQRLPSIPGAEGAPPMSRLPLLLRTGELAALLCPANGGELCWINVARAGNSITLSNVQ